MVYEGQPEKPAPIKDEDRAPFWEGLGDKITDKFSEFEKEEVCAACAVAGLVTVLTPPVLGGSFGAHALEQPALCFILRAALYMC